jgi:hypothetical protein
MELLFRVIFLYIISVIHFIVPSSSFLTYFSFTFCFILYMFLLVSQQNVTALYSCYSHALGWYLYSYTLASHIEHFTSALTPFLFPLVFAFILAAHLESFCVVERFKLAREQLGAM